MVGTYSYLGVILRYVIIFSTLRCSEYFYDLFHAYYKLHIFSHNCYINVTSRYDDNTHMLSDDAAEDAIALT